MSKKDRGVFGENLKRIREEKSISQELLANEVNLTTSAIGSYETGKAKPSIEVLSRIADVLQVSTDELLGRSNYANNSDNSPTDSNSTYLTKDQMLAKLINEMEFKTRQLQRCEEEVDRLKNGNTPVYGK